MFKRVIPASFIGLMVLAFSACQKLSPQQAHFDSAYSKFKEGDFTSALLYLKPLVESGHPGAELLMARMYANGEGVPEDMGKAELLRNLAAYQIYKNKEFTPGEARPANETLKGISDRLDYYVGAEEGNKEAENKSPPQDLTEVLKSVDLKGVADLQKMNTDTEAGPPDVAIEIPHEKIAGHEEEASPPVTSPPEEPSSVLPQAEPVKPSVTSGDSRGSDQITLGVVRQAATEGDPQAMELLSAAYTQGFYGLTPNPKQAAKWAMSAKQARLRQAPEEDVPSEKSPFDQAWKIMVLGVVLIGVGVWRWWKTRLG